MNFYEPFSRLFKKADNSKLKSSVTVYLPANINLAETKFSDDGTTVTIEYSAEQSDSDSAARPVTMIKEFNWNGANRNVSTEVFDLNGTSGGKNVISTTQATVY